MDNYNLKQIVQHAEKVENEIISLKEQLQKALTPIGQLKPMLEYTAPNEHVAAPEGGTYYHPVKHSLATLDKDEETNKKRYEYALTAAKENEEIEKYNINILQQLIKIINAAGYSSEKSIFKRNKYVKETNEWKTNLSSLIPRKLHSVQDIEYKWQRYQKNLKEARAKVNQELEQIKKQQEVEDKKTKSYILIGQIVAEMKLEGEFQTADNVIDALIDKDQYLKLAKAMEDTRIDWSDGFYKVQNALSSFVPQNEEDKLAMEEISDLANGEESDGRIFRDCKYNYNWILDNKVDKEIYKNYYKLLEFIQNV